jgi:hypothetical protein
LTVCPATPALVLTGLTSTVGQSFSLTPATGSLLLSPSTSTLLITRFLNPPPSALLLAGETATFHFFFAAVPSTLALESLTSGIVVQGTGHASPSISAITDDASSSVVLAMKAVIKETSSGARIQ